MRRIRKKLAQWLSKLEYDHSHDASRKKPAQDQAQIQALEERFGTSVEGFIRTAERKVTPR